MVREHDGVGVRFSKEMLTSANFRECCRLVFIEALLHVECILYANNYSLCFHAINFCTSQESLLTQHSAIVQRPAIKVAMWLVVLALVLLIEWT